MTTLIEQELAELTKFTPEQVDEYEGSLKDYLDLQNSLDKATYEGFKKGEERGIEIGIEIKQEYKAKEIAKKQFEKVWI
jgi:hypothetical protein